jgi:hypothetical protein
MMRSVGCVGAALALVAGLVPAVATGAAPPVAATGQAGMPFDFDGDGYADLAVGVPGEDLGSRASRRDAGAVQVLYGSRNGPSARDQVWHQSRRGIKGVAERGDHFGEVVASGDFDADGYADLAVGVPREGVGAAEESGVVQVLYGGRRGLTARDQIWRQGKAGVPGTPYDSNVFGRSLAAGDFDGDGFADLAIATGGGLPQVEPVELMRFAKGHLVVLRGSPTGLTSAGLQSWSVDTPGLELPGVCATKLAAYPEIGACSIGAFARSLTAGDVNGDGRDDLAFLAPSGPRYGPFSSWDWAVLVLLGSSSGLSTAGQQLLTVEQMGGYLEFARGGSQLPRAEGGTGLAGPQVEWDDLTLADFNGDSRDDLAISERARNDVRTGGIAVLYAGAGGFTPSAKQVWYPNRLIPDAEGIRDCGRDDLVGGDLNADGYAELVVGSVSDCAVPPVGGVVHVLGGSAGGLVAPWTVITQGTAGIPGAAEPPDRFGEAVAVLPFAGGRTGWLAVGSPGEGLGRLAEAGRVVVVPGSASGLRLAASRSWHQRSRGIKGAAERGDAFGSAVGMG